MRFAVALLLCLAVGRASAQTGRFEESKRLGLAYLKDGKYDRAAAKLEEVYDIDKSDPLVNESLAIAYMNGDDRKNNPDMDTKAFGILDKAIANGGKVPLLVHLTLGSSLFSSIGSSPTSFCAGRLTLQPGRVVFVCERGDKPLENSFDLTGGQIKEVGEKFKRGKGMFFIRTDKRTYNFVPANWEQEHSQFFLALAEKYLAVRKAK